MATPTQLVQQILDGFGRGDLEAILAAMSPDVVFEHPGPAVIPMAGTYHGAGEVKRFFVTLATTMETTRFDVRGIAESGDQAILFAYYEGRVRATGKTAGYEFCMPFQVKDGRVVRFREYLDTAAVAAAFA